MAITVKHTQEEWLEICRDLTWGNWISWIFGHGMGMEKLG